MNIVKSFFEKDKWKQHRVQMSIVARNFRIATHFVVIFVLKMTSLSDNFNALTTVAVGLSSSVPFPVHVLRTN